MEKINLGSTIPAYPMPVVLVGAHVNGKPNFMTVAWFCMASYKPPRIAIALGKNHHTNPGIKENKAFSVCLPSEDMVEVTDYCGIVTGEEADKSELFEVFYGELKTAPMIAECRVNLECRVVKAFGIEQRQIYVGEVVQTYVEEGYVVEKEGRRGLVEMTELEPIIYGLDNRYYGIGEMIGVGYKEGKGYQREGGA